MIFRKVGAVFFSATFLLAACGQGEEESSTSYREPFEGKVEHVHGVGFVGGDDLALAAHDGLKFYSDGNWQRTTSENNDYMGFNAVDNGFYTSGHPGKDSPLPNPIGIQKSNDLGQNLDAVAFEGEFDFHLMGVGYENHAIYIWNEHGNEALEEGLHKSLDVGKSFEAVESSGVKGEIKDLAVHPTNEEMIAVATKQGIFLSEDGGQTFDALSEKPNGTFVYFKEDTLTYGTFDSQAHVIRYAIEDQSFEEIAIPKFEQDAVAYFSSHPEEENRMMIFSFKNDGYYTENGGKNWSKIVDQGKVKE